MPGKALTFNTLVEKALNDRDFRKELVEDPEAALEAAGFVHPKEVVSALKKVDWVSLQRVAHSFGTGNRVDTAFC